MAFWNNSLGVYVPSCGNSLVTLTLNGAAAGGYSQTWLALSFIPQTTKQLSKVIAYVHSITGTLAATDYSCSLFASSTTNGDPTGAAIETKTLAAAPSGAGWVEWTGFTTSVTAGTMYYIVLRNANATPTTNYMTYRFSNANLAPSQYFQPTTYGWIKTHSTDGGATWGSRLGDAATVRLEYGGATPTFEGFAFEDSGFPTTADFQVYSTREVGTQFTTPPNACLCVAGVAFSNGAAVGSPTGNPQFRLYAEAVPKLQGTTHTIPKGQFSTQSWRSAFFATTILLGPSTVVTVTLSETTNSDSSSNYYWLNYMKCKNDASSRALWPFSPKHAYYDGSSWSYTDNAIHPFLLLLDQRNDFWPPISPQRPSFAAAGT
jgi:hypothetical protein